MHSLATALILTLALVFSLNHLANKLLQTTSTLYGLKYLTKVAQWIINIQ